MEPPSTHPVLTFNRSGRRFPLRRVREAIEAALSGDSRPGSVEFSLVSDPEIAELNRASRGIDEATDVLSFPAPEFPGSPLGEIVVSLDYAQRQARERGISTEAEVCYLAIHGALHLIGMDDEDEADRSRMFARMHEIGAAIGLPEERRWTSLLKEAAPR